LFDIVDHGVLAQKLICVQLPKRLYTWILSFLSCGSQQVKWCGHVFTLWVKCVLLPITLANVNWFSNVCHCWILQ